MISSNFETISNRQHLVLMQRLKANQSSFKNPSYDVQWHTTPEGQRLEVVNTRTGEITYFGTALVGLNDLKSYTPLAPGIYFKIFNSAGGHHQIQFKSAKSNDLRDLLYTFARFLGQEKNFEAEQNSYFKQGLVQVFKLYLSPSVSEDHVAQTLSTFFKSERTIALTFADKNFKFTPAHYFKAVPVITSLCVKTHDSNFKGSSNLQVTDDDSPNLLGQTPDGWIKLVKTKRPNQDPKFELRYENVRSAQNYLETLDRMKCLIDERET